MKFPRALSFFFASLVSLTCGACGAFAGAAALAPAANRPVEFGPSAGYRAYLGSSEGFFLGGSGSLGLPESPAHDRGHVLAEGRFGYGNLPLPVRGHFGFEAWLSGVVGIAPASRDASFAPGYAVGLGVPYRISRTRAPWEVEAPLMTYAFVEPTASFVQVFPTTGERSVDNLVVLALVVGYDRLRASGNDDRAGARHQA